MKTQTLLFFSIFAAGALARSGYGHGADHSAHDLHTYPNLAACIREPSFFSCENTTPIRNTCCSPTPGGLVLQTQFWSTYTGLERRGQKLPKGSWGIHGLWPDNCDGCVSIHWIHLSVPLKPSFAGLLSNTVTSQGSTTPPLLPPVSPTAPRFPPTRAQVLTPSSRSSKGVDYWITVRLGVPT